MDMGKVTPSIKVLAGSPCGKMPVCNEFFNCFYQLDMPPGSLYQRVIGGSIPTNLNTLVDYAQENKCTHIFIVEDDSLFERDTVLRLLKHNKPVVTGLCRQRSMPFRSYIYSGLHETDGLTWYTLKPTDSRLIKCAATGMGGILINMDIFKKLTRPYFTTYHVGEKEWGQDIMFGKSLIEAGVDVYCDTDVIIGHVTQCTIGSSRSDTGWNVVLRVHEAMVEIPQL